MPRRAIGRLAVEGRAYCYHITQRCQERRYLLQYVKDRRRYLMRLWETTQRYPVSVLNYAVTSNHIHLLLWAERAASVSAAMQYLSGSAAQDYNRRLHREGAFWRGRYRPTLIESGRHLTRCFFYIELNMVRAGVVSYPGDWYGGASREHTGERKRYRVIDRERLLHCMECPGENRFSEWYLRTLQQECERGYHVREGFWTEAAAVGSRRWAEALAERVPQSWCAVERVTNSDAEVAESPATYVVKMSNRLREGLLGMLG